jgi:hypothetical protein
MEPLTRPAIEKFFIIFLINFYFYLVLWKVTRTFKRLVIFCAWCYFSVNHEFSSLSAFHSCLIQKANRTTHKLDRFFLMTKLCDNIQILKSIIVMKQRVLKLPIYRGFFHNPIIGILYLFFFQNLIRIFPIFFCYFHALKSGRRFIFKSLPLREYIHMQFRNWPVGPFMDFYIFNSFVKFKTRHETIDFSSNFLNFLIGFEYKEIFRIICQSHRNRVILDCDAH